MVKKKEFLEELRKTVPASVVESVVALVDKWERIEAMERAYHQKIGIEKAKEAGITFGRPRKQVPDNFEAIAESFLDKKMSSETAAKACGVGLSTFYRRMTDYKQRKGVNENEEERESRAKRGKRREE